MENLAATPIAYTKKMGIIKIPRDLAAVVSKKRLPTAWGSHSLRLFYHADHCLAIIVDAEKKTVKYFHQGSHKFIRQSQIGWTPSSRMRHAWTENQFLSIDQDSFQIVIARYPTLTEVQRLDSEQYISLEVIPDDRVIVAGGRFKNLRAFNLKTFESEEINVKDAANIQEIRYLKGASQLIISPEHRAELLIYDWKNKAVSQRVKPFTAVIELLKFDFFNENTMLTWCYNDSELQIWKREGPTSPFKITRKVDKEKESMDQVQVIPESPYFLIRKRSNHSLQLLTTDSRMAPLLKIFKQVQPMSCFAYDPRKGSVICAGEYYGVRVIYFRDFIAKESTFV